MKRNFLISIWMTVATTLLLGIGYPLAVTGLAQWLFPRQANGEIVQVHGRMLGSSLIGQPFSTAGYFHSRPSVAGPAGYDPDAAGGGASNLGPTNSALITRVNGDVLRLHAEILARRFQRIWSPVQDRDLIRISLQLGRSFRWHGWLGNVG